VTQQATLREAPSKYHGKHMSLEEYEALPEEKPYLEYWDGVVLQKAVPTRRHQKLELEIAVRLRDYGRAVGGDSWAEGHVWFEGRGWRLPDVGYWGPEKDQGDERRSLPPTLAIEIRSPEQSMPELRDKFRQMLANGVDVCWIIDPQRRRAEVFDGDADAAVVPDDGSLRSAHLPGFELPLGELWSAMDR
jgi:Uma2 family endonuclease